MAKAVVSVRAKRMWQRLIEWYGTRLVEQYGELPPADWAETVDSVDNDVIRRGLTVIRTKYIQHPPTFPQFAEAMAPNRGPKGQRTESVQEKLCRYVMHAYGDMLTSKQISSPWTYIGKRFPGQNLDGKTVEDHGIEITGVVIDADGDSQGYRIMVIDMDAASVDWSHPQVPAVESYAEDSHDVG